MKSFGIFTIAFFIHIICFGQEKIFPGGPDMTLTSYDELSSYVRQLDRSSDLLKVKVIGKSVEGKDLYALMFSSSQFGKDRSKIRVLIFAQQHGNEQSGKEGALAACTGVIEAGEQVSF